MPCLAGKRPRRLLLFGSRPRPLALFFAAASLLPRSPPPRWSPFFSAPTTPRCPSARAASSTCPWPSIRRTCGPSSAIYRPTASRRGFCWCVKGGREGRGWRGGRHPHSSHIGQLRQFADVATVVRIKGRAGTFDIDLVLIDIDTLLTSFIPPFTWSPRLQQARWAAWPCTTALSRHAYSDPPSYSSRSPRPQ